MVKPTIKTEKKLERYENHIKIAYEQAKALKRNFHIFNNDLSIQVKRYEAFLVKEKLEPTLNLEAYKLNLL